MPVGINESSKHMGILNDSGMHYVSLHDLHLGKRGEVLYGAVGDSV